jgi:hypothetical protein
MSELEDLVNGISDETLLQVIRSMKPQLQEKMKGFLKDKHPEICKRLETAQDTHLEQVFLSLLKNAEVQKNVGQSSGQTVT